MIFNRKNNIKPLSIIWAVAILLLSILSLNNIDKDKLEIIPHLDKLVHFVLYLIFSLLISLEYFKKSNKRFEKFLIPVGITILYGGFMEILQLISTFRSTDIYDFLFNCMGSITGAIIFGFFNKLKNNINPD